MAFKFGKKSKECIATLDTRLQTIVNIAILTVDFAVIEGHRGEDRQNELLVEGKTQLAWPLSRHNTSPSKAMDILPAPYDWNNRESFIRFAAFIIGIGAALGVVIRWGGDWDRDWDLKDNKFNDYPHFEIVDL
jgi:peptidoglycan L-alanyl-D-glutamate endopeptidase CwlK